MVWLILVVVLPVAASFFVAGQALWLYVLTALPALVLRRLLPARPRRR